MIKSGRSVTHPYITELLLTPNGMKTERFNVVEVLMRYTFGCAMTFRTRQMTSFMFSSRGGGDGKTERKVLV